VTALPTQPRWADAGGRAPGGWASRLRRPRPGEPGQPAWARPALAALLVATAVLYLAGLSRNGWANDFYAAAVQAGTKSWKAFLFGSFDSANFITIDKTPASLWVMELSARVLGVNYWSLLVPQALEGVAAVGVLYATVRRWFGPAAAIIAGAVMAVMFRFNNPDALLVLVLVLAAYATTRALESGRTRWLVLAGALLGLGYLTKMLQAFLVLPVFALVYLVAGPPRLGRRIGQLLAGGAALVVGAGWWVAIVMLTPAADRPYIGGSTNNSILQLTFGYNGLGRLDGNETGSVGFGNGSGPAFGGPASLTRLFGAEMGGQISWLIPAALAALAALLWMSRRSPRTDKTRSAALLWGGWLVLTGLVFSYMSGIIHPYYTVALAPSVGALAGIGAVALWRDRRTAFARVALTAMLVVTAGWAWVLLGRSPGWYPWLRVAVVAAALGSAAVVLAWPWLAGAGDGRPAAAGRGRTLLAAVPLSLAMIAGLGGPLAYSVNTAATAHTGALASAGPAVTGVFGGPGALGGRARFGARGGFGGFGGFSGGRFGGSAGSGAGGAGGAGGSGGSGGSGGGSAPAGQPGFAGGSASAGQFPGGAPGGFGGRGFGGRGFAGGGLGGSTQVSSALTKLLKAGAAGYTWAAATVGSESAAPLQLAAGQPVLAVGGFNGTDPAPTLAQFEKLVSEHKIHYFVGQNRASFGGGSGDASRITSWVESHFTAETVDGVTVYNLAGQAASL
jgi:4-amino-4-deoxy-L-arabinose transferase-like glycosyltransferase